MPKNVIKIVAVRLSIHPAIRCYSQYCDFPHRYFGSLTAAVMPSVVQSVEAETLRTLLRAIEKRNEVDIDYQSLTNARVPTIAPHSASDLDHRKLRDCRWHRAADRQQIWLRPLDRASGLRRGILRIDRGVLLRPADTAVSSLHAVKESVRKHPTKRPTWPVARLASPSISLRNSRVRRSSGAPTNCLTDNQFQNRSEMTPD